MHSKLKQPNHAASKTLHGLHGLQVRSDIMLDAHDGQLMSHCLFIVQLNQGLPG